MEKIKVKSLNKPKRLTSNLSMKTADIVKLVNNLANPGKTLINRFEGYTDAKAAVHIKDDVYIEESSKKELIFGGEVSMDVSGDFLHEDPGRVMWIGLNSTTLYGAIINGNLTMDTDSKWVVTSDSNIHLLSFIDLVQSDAPEGVTIRASGGQEAVYELTGGGRLVVEE